MRQVAEVLSDRTFKRMRLLIFFILAASYMYAPFSRMAPGIMGPELMQSFGLGAVQFGLLGLCFMWPYALGQMPAGIFADRCGSSKALCGMLLMTAAGNFLFGAAPDFYALLGGRVLIGLSVAGYFLVGTKIISAWYAKEEFTAIYGIFMGLGALGGVVSTVPLQMMMQAFGWRHAMYILGAFSLLLAAGVFAWVRDNPPQAQAAAAVRPASGSKVSVSQQLKNVAAVPFVFNCAFICLSVSGSGHSLQSLWNGVYLADVYGFDAATTGIILLCAAIGMVIGGTGAGFCMERFSKTALIAGGEGIFLLSWFYMAANAGSLGSVELMAVNFTLGLMQMLVVTCCYTLVKETAPPALLATSMGLVNTFIWVLGVGLCQQLWGVIIGAVSGGVKPYGAEAFAAAMWFQLCVIVFGFANALYVYKKVK